MFRVRARWFGLVAVFGTVVGLAVLLTRDGSQTVRLEDGASVALRRAGFGKSDQFAPGPWWHGTLARFAPGRLLARWRIPVFASNATNDVLWVWLEFDGVRPPRNPLHLVTVADGHGLESSRIQPWRSMFDTNGHGCAGYRIDNLPRRSRSLTIAVYEGRATNWVLAAAFRIDNPVAPGAPSFTAVPLPQTRRDGDTDFTLLAVQTGLEATGHVSMYGATWSELVFRIGTNEPGFAGTNAAPFGPWTNRALWTIRSVECGTAAGDFIQARSPQGRVAWQDARQMVSRLNDGVALVNGALWPEEAWRLRVEFRRDFSGALPEHALWTVRVPVPRAGEEITLTNSAVVEGATIRLIAITNTQSVTSSPPLLPLRLTAETRAPSAAFELRFARAVDGQGSNVIRLAGSPGRPPHEFRLAVLPSAKEMEVTLAVLRSCTVEFTARPSRLRTNVAHWQ
jgi:hypothetical protein